MLSPADVLARAIEPGRRFNGSSSVSTTPAQVLARALDHGVARFPKGLQSRPERCPSAPEQLEPDPPPAFSDVQFWQIWMSNRDYLLRCSLRFSSGNAADAEDALSDAMLKAAAAFRTTVVRNQRAWLLRLVHNACMDRHRGYQRQNRIVKDAAHDGDYLFPAVAPQPDRSPEELLSALQFATQLQRALDELPRSLAEPLRLYLDNRPDAEIAGNLNVTKEVIRKRRQMARDWLRRRLQG